MEKARVARTAPGRVQARVQAREQATQRPGQF